VATLRRELEEELGVSELVTSRPLGLVVDTSSLVASRHVGLVYEVEIAGQFVALAREEFSIRSKYTGRFFGPAQLSGLRPLLDPWSLILFEDYISAAAAINVPRQPALPLHLPRSSRKRKTE